jgi:predicted transcriptional regulator
MGEEPLSLHVNAEVGRRLEREARSQNISASDLVERAIESYFEVCESEREVLRQRVAEADKGVFISGEAMHRWIASWGTENELPPPEPDIFLPPRVR